MTAAPALTTPDAGDRMIGAHPSMVRLRDEVQRAAALSGPVLIHGPTGAGKELVAELLHEQSGRRGRLISLNVASLPTELAEAELFGVVRGAFTGATASRAGLIEQAAGGTLYLDEAADLPLPLQGKLLRVLETGVVRRVGGDERTVPFRLVVSVQQPCGELLPSGRWREDFFYRVTGILLRVPPLRERRSDLGCLSDHFLAAIGPARLVVEALSVLGRHDWPGNVRELRRVLERAAFVSESECIEPQHVAAAIAFGDGRRASDAAHDGLIRATLADVEGSYIRQVLQESEFNVTTSAQVLGLSPWALYRKLRSHGIELRGAERLAKSPRRA